MNKGKTKSYLKNIIATFLLLAGLSIAPVSAMAQNWSAGMDSSGNFGFTIGSGGGGTGTFRPYNPGLPEGKILDIFSGFLFWLLAIFSVVGIVGFVLSGIFYLLAGADESMAEKGKEGMKWSIIGVIVGLSGFIIMQAVGSALDAGAGY